MGMRIVKTSHLNAYKLLTAGLLMGLLLIWACEKTGTMDKETVDFISLKQLNDCPAIVTDTRLSDDFWVINTQEELEQSVLIGVENPHLCELLKEELVIDFTKHTLLIGKTKISHVKGELVSEEIFRYDDKSYTYHLIIKNGGYTALGLFRFGAIIPKIPNGTKVNLEVKVEERL